MGIKVRKKKCFECGWVGSRQLSDRKNSGGITLGGIVGRLWIVCVRGVAGDEGERKEGVGIRIEIGRARVTGNLRRKKDADKAESDLQCQMQSTYCYIN